MSHIKSARPSATVAIFLLLLCMFAWPAQTAAQVNNPDQLFALGVVIDSDGLISVREPTSDVKVLAARKEALVPALTPKSRQRDEAGKLKELATRPENGQWEVIK